MDKDELEVKYLCAEAHKLHEFLRQVKERNPVVGVVPNMSYGLVAISPLLSRLRKEGFHIHLNKIGSSESHNNSNILGSTDTLPLTLLAGEVQPSFVVIDGTRNTGGSNPSGNKYPDSQQGYLNFVALLNDIITGNQVEQYASLIGVSGEHIEELRGRDEYSKLRKIAERALGSRKPAQPFAFKYWNPAGLELSIYNHGTGCIESAQSFQISDDPVAPTVFFVNSVMPEEKHSEEHRALWGSHRPAYFDDNNGVNSFQFSFDTRGVYPLTGLGKVVEVRYRNLFVNPKNETEKMPEPARKYSND